MFNNILLNMEKQSDIIPEKLSVSTGLSYMSYEDSERLKQILLEQKLKEVYCIYGEDDTEIYHVVACSKKNAIIQFIESEDFVPDEYDKIIYSDNSDNPHKRCLICLVRLEYDSVNEDHLKTHSYEDFLDYYINIFNERYTCKQIKLDSFKKLNLLKRLNINDCAIQKDMGNSFIVTEKEKNEKFTIHSHNNTELQEKLLDRICPYISILDIHIKFICRDIKCSYEDTVVNLCEICRNEGLCFICNKSLGTRKNLYRHFIKHSWHEIPCNIMSKYIKSKYTIKERRSENIERIQAFKDEINKKE